MNQKRGGSLHLRVAGLFVFKDRIHQPEAVGILSRSPFLPWIFAEMKVRKDGNFECAIALEGETWFSKQWVWVHLEVAVDIHFRIICVGC